MLVGRGALRGGGREAAGAVEAVAGADAGGDALVVAAGAAGSVLCDGAGGGGIVDVGAVTTAAAEVAGGEAGAGVAVDRPRSAHAVATAATAMTPPAIHPQGTGRFAGSTLSMATRISASEGGSSSSAIFHFTRGGGFDGAAPGRE